VYTEPPPLHSPFIRGRNEAMKKASSIVLVCLLLLGAQCASAQEVVDPLDISNNCWGANPSRSGWNYNSSTVGMCCARPPVTEPRNYYDIFPNGSDRHSYTMTPSGVVRGLGNTTSPVAVGAIDNNFWGTGIAPPITTSGSCPCNWAGSSSIFNANNITFSCAGSLTSQTTFSGECSVLGSVTKKEKGPKSQSMDTTTQCTKSLYDGINYGYNYEYQLCYDSLQAFVNRCYNDPISYRAFTPMSSSEQYLELKDSTLRIQYRLWLESVLYLNTTVPEYFCACVEALAGTFYIPNSNFAVLNWLIANTTCDTPYLSQEYMGGRLSQYQTWRDGDTSIPLDTTLPTMKQLGIDTLLARHSLMSVSELPQGILSNATANPNPTNEGTVISFAISKEAYVKIELFDLLGHEVHAGEDASLHEWLIEPGNKSVPISLAGLAPGTYDARILTAYGEVQTVKLVKE